MDLFARLQVFKTNAYARAAVLAVNLVGIVYGFYYYAGAGGMFQINQFAQTPWYLWLFVPDSPLAVFWAALALALYGFGRTRFDWLDALAFTANVQVGLWTAYVLVAYWDWFGIGTLNLNFLLFWAHLGMVVLALLFVHDLRRSLGGGDAAARRRRWRVLGGVLAWFLLNDVVDYLAFDIYGTGCGLRPMTVPCTELEPVTAIVTLALSVGAVAALASLVSRPHAGAREEVVTVPVRERQ